jgi:hypothetical protein
MSRTLTISLGGVVLTLESIPYPQHYPLEESIILGYIIEPVISIYVHIFLTLSGIDIPFLLC